MLRQQKRTVPEPSNDDGRDRGKREGLEVDATPRSRQGEPVRLRCPSAVLLAPAASEDFAESQDGDGNESAPAAYAPRTA